MTHELVLIVEASHETQQLLVDEVIEPGGYRLLLARDGERGIHLAIEERPDLIILDLHAQKPCGIDVLQALEQRDVRIPVIVTTTGESAELIVEAYRLGAQDCIIEPIDPQEMGKSIRGVLASTVLNKERARLTRVQARAEQTRWKAVLWGAQEPIVVVDDEDTVILCNAAARVALDLGEEDLTGLPAGESIPHPALLSMLSQTRATRTSTRSEVPLDDGRTFNAQLTPIAGVGRVLVMQDITHLKEMDRVKSEFVTAVSHDLRTPLTTIQGYVELLPRAGSLTSQQHDFTQHILRSLETITELVNNLLDSDRLDAGLDLEMGPCDLLEVIDQAIDNFRPRAEQRRQELRWDPPQSLPPVLGNRHRLLQVLDNLLNNAMKYTREGGWIAVSAIEDDGHIVVHVADNGIGILPAQQPYIFDKFYRVESEETLRITGTGLGLSIVKTVIEKHNGRVWVESKAGVGSTFSFVLPAMET